jgi:hypothetical protein
MSTSAARPIEGLHASLAGSRASSLNSEQVTGNRERAPGRQRLPASDDRDATCGAAEFALVPPQMPYVGGADSRMSDFFMRLMGFIAIGPVLRRHGVPLPVIGEIEREIYKAQLLTVPESERLASGRQFMSAEDQAFLREQAARSLAQEYTEDFVYDFVEPGPSAISASRSSSRNSGRARRSPSFVASSRGLRSGTTASSSLDRRSVRGATPVNPAITTRMPLPATTKPAFAPSRPARITKRSSPARKTSTPFSPCRPDARRLLRSSSEKSGPPPPGLPSSAATCAWP